MYCTNVCIWNTRIEEERKRERERAQCIINIIFMMNGLIPTGTRNSVKWIDNINNKDILRLSVWDVQCTRDPHTFHAHSLAYLLAHNMYFTRDDLFSQHFYACNVFTINLFVLQIQFLCSKFNNLSMSVWHSYW